MTGGLFYAIGGCKQLEIKRIIKVYCITRVAEL